jgi:hypothetical protein
LFVDKCSTKTFAYHLKRKSDIVMAFKKNPQRFPRCLEMRILHTDFDSLVLDKNFNDILVEKNTSAPYKHQQNLAERYVFSIKNGIRTVMAYNNAPIRYWCYAMDYFCYTFNNLPRINETRNFLRSQTRSQSFCTVLLFWVLPCMSRRAGHFTRVWFSRQSLYI